jgi:hypothetical protein
MVESIGHFDAGLDTIARGLSGLRYKGGCSPLLAFIFEFLHNPPFSFVRVWLVLSRKFEFYGTTESSSFLDDACAFSRRDADCA